MSGGILLATDARGVATLTLNRTERRNAFDDALIAALHEACRQLAADSAVRIIVLTGAGSAFSAGADLAWMQRMAGYSEAENEADALRLAEMLQALDTLPQPTVARINGAAFAGAIGLICCCDIAIAADSAVFAISEARLGLVPATISPYVLRAIGARAARRYFLSAESFSAAEALRLGLVHEMVPTAELDAATERVIAALLAGAPQAQTKAKHLIGEVTHRAMSSELMQETARAIAAARASVEGREGLAAFLEKRKPRWRD